jgi:hypothetical protein
MGIRSNEQWICKDCGWHNLFVRKRCRNCDCYAHEAIVIDPQHPNKSRAMLQKVVSDHKKENAMAEDIHLTRADDIDTSVQAAEAVKRKLSARMQLVHDVLVEHPDGLTDEELTQIIIGRGHPAGGESSYRKRRTDLRNRGLVEDTGERRKNSRGAPVAIWRIVK